MMSSSYAPARAATGVSERRGRGRGGSRGDALRSRGRDATRGRGRGEAFGARDRGELRHRSRGRPDLVRDNWRRNLIASRGHGRHNSLAEHASESSIPLHRRHRIYLSMDEPREHTPDSKTTHTANGDHDRRGTHPFPSAHAAAGNTEHRAGLENEHQNMASEPKELIDASGDITQSLQDDGYQPYIQRFGPPPPRMAPMTALETVAADDVFTLQPETSPSPEHVSDPEASVGQGLKTEDFISLIDRKASVMGKNSEKSVDDLFDALQATEAAEIEAVRLGVLERKFPPLAPETAASQNKDDPSVDTGVLISFEDDEPSSYHSQGSGMMDGEDREGNPSNGLGGCSEARSYNPTPALEDTTERLNQGHNAPSQNIQYQLPAVLPSPLAILAAFDAHPRRLEAARVEEKQIRKGHPSLDQESPRGESWEPVVSAETVWTEPQGMGEQAQKQMGSQHMKNRKTKARLKRRKAEKALKGTKLSNPGEAREDSAMTREEAPPQRFVQTVAMPTPPPAVQVAEGLTPTNATARSVADAAIDDSFHNEQVNADKPIDATREENKKPTRKRTKALGQGARQRKRLRELRTRTSQDVGELISFDDDGTFG